MSGKLKIRVCGHGPELVLVHGWAMHSGVWSELVEVLSREFRVNLVDLPGHGINHDLPLDEDLKVIANLLLSELPPATWIGWSLGGLITQASALIRPEHIQGMVLVAATPSFMRRGAWPYGMEVTPMQSFITGLETDLTGTIKRFLALQTINSDAARKTLKVLRATAFGHNTPVKATLHTGLQLLHDSNLIECLGSCTVPTLFLGGSRDRLVHPQALQQAAANMPNAAAHVIDGAGHAPFVGHREMFLESLHGFIAKEKAA